MVSCRIQPPSASDLQCSLMREVNFNYLLASLMVLMITGPVLREYTPLDHPEVLEMVSGLFFCSDVAFGHFASIAVALNDR